MTTTHGCLTLTRVAPEEVPDRRPFGVVAPAGHAKWRTDAAAELLEDRVAAYQEAGVDRILLATPALDRMKPCAMLDQLSRLTPTQLLAIDAVAGLYEGLIDEWGILLGETLEAPARAERDDGSLGPAERARITASEAWGLGGWAPRREVFRRAFVGETLGWISILRRQCRVSVIAPGLSDPVHHAAAARAAIIETGAGAVTHADGRPAYRLGALGDLWMDENRPQIAPTLTLTTMSELKADLRRGADLGSIDFLTRERHLVLTGDYELALRLAGIESDYREHLDARVLQQWCGRGGVVSALSLDPDVILAAVAWSKVSDRLRRGAQAGRADLSLMAADPIDDPGEGMPIGAVAKNRLLRASDPHLPDRKDAR